MTDITELMELKQKAIKAEETAEVYLAKARGAWKLLSSKCTHPTTIKTEKYNEGGYDYVSSIYITIKCSICSSILTSYKDPNHKGSHA